MNTEQLDRVVFLADHRMKLAFVFRRGPVITRRREPKPAPFSQQMCSQMLQSAIFSGNHASTVAIGREPSIAATRRIEPLKNGFARLAMWGRVLFARDDLHGMSSRLLRDIGLDGLD